MADPLDGFVRVDAPARDPLDGFVRVETPGATMGPGVGGHPLARRASVPLLGLPRATPEEVAAGPTKAAAFSLRAAPGLVPAPAVSAPLSAGGEALAQLVESGEITSPEQVALAGAIPPAAATVGRFGRAMGRTAVRVFPGMFERAQKAAQEAGEALVSALRPTEDVAQLAASARAGGTDLIPTKNVQSMMRQITLPAKPANPQMEAVKTTVENLKSVLDPRGNISLDALEAIRQDIGPLLQSKQASPQLRGLYGAIVRDLEETAAAGGVGATLAREAATAFKRDLGAAKVGELIEKSTSRRVISGADVPALNVSRFSKLINEPKTKQALLGQIGADGFRTVEEFITKFRTLPPDVAYNGWGRMLGILGGGVGAVTGIATGTPIAPIIGLITPEIATNMALVGRNPDLLNRLMITTVQAVRAAAPGTRTP